MTTINSTPSTILDEPTPIVRKYRVPHRLLTCAIVLGWLFDWAFYDKALGVSVLLYAAMLVVTLIYAGRTEDVDMPRNGRWLLALIGLFGVMVFVRANLFLTLLNVSAVFILLILYAYYFSAENIVTQSIASYFIVPLKMITVPWFASFGVLNEVRLEAQADERPNRLPIASIMRGLLIAAPILFVFTGLLISADVVFAQRLERWFQIPDFSELLARALLIGWIAWLSMGTLAYALTRGQSLLSPEQQAKVGAEVEAHPRRFSLGFIESSIVLGMVNLLFGFFVTIQFAYLFGGLNNIQIDGYTFAQYARKGFFELVVVAVLVLAMLLLFKWLGVRETQRQTLSFNGLSTVMVALVTVMLMSAFRRMSLYEWTYGFSELRLYSHVFIVWIGIVLVWFIVTLWLRPNHFAIGLFVAALGFIMTLNVLNPDALIVRQNWARFQLMKPYLDDEQAVTNSAPEVSEQPSADNNLPSINRNGDMIIRGVSVANARSNRNVILDLIYLSTLSNDAVPELLRILPELSGDDLIDLETDLQQREAWLANWNAEQPWQSFHLTHARTYRMLQPLYGTSQTTSQ